MENHPSFNYRKVFPKNVFAELSQSYKLSEEQKSFYEQNGYLVIKQLFDFASLYNYKQRFHQVCNGLVNRGMMTIVKEPALVKPGAKPEEYVNKINDVHFDEVFTMYTENPLLLNVVSQFLGNGLRSMHSMFINKPPGTNEHPAHQDLLYFPIRPANKIICAYTAIDDMDKENGCLYVIPGSHKKNTLYEHSTSLDDKKLYYGVRDELVPDGDRVYVDLSPGDTLFFHPLILHGSGPNTSKKFRKTILCHYMSSECQFMESVPAEQKTVAKSVEAEAKRRGIPVSFTDVWRYKSKEIIVESKL